MTLLTGFTGYPLIHALGWTLLHFCWQGALVAAMLWCVLGLLGGRSSQARYLAACAAMLLMATLPLITFSRLAIAEYQMRSAVEQPGTIFSMSIFLHGNPLDSAPSWPQRMAFGLDHAMPWLLALWLLGAMFFLARLSFGLVEAHRLRCIGVELPGDALLRRFDALKLRLNVGKAVRLLHSVRVQVPTVIGWLRPAVLLPLSCIAGLSTDQIDAILCHELAHIRRHDYLVSVFQSLAEALLFYHPAVWWVSKQLRRERECCCDELAVASCGDALSYANALSYLEQRRAAVPELLLGANGGVLTMRIKRLLGYPGNTGTPRVAALVLLALVATISTSYIATAARAQKAVHPVAAAAMVADAVSPASPGQASPAPADGLPPHGIYKRWLTQDALWIITPAEREAFLRLQNDTERDAFIASFWTKRDAPGSEQGSYREDYYARMAYANEHFASDKSVGWHTDRGHAYLLYGKPESIDSHPTGGQLAEPGGTVNLQDPFEVWHYAAVGSSNVDLLFVDTCRCGEYNITSESSSELPGLSTNRRQPFTHVFTPVKLSVQPGSTSPQAAAPSHGAGEISGIIIDPTGALVPRATVRTVNTDTGAAMTRITDNTGAYSFSPLPAGPYNLEVSAPGFERMLQENIKVGDAQNVELNLKLIVGAARETLSITARPVLAAQAPQAPVVVVPRARAGMPLRVSSGTMAGNLIRKVDPVYPDQAKAAHVEGEVILHATISKQGTIENVEVVSGPPALIVGSIDAVRQWQYKPYLLNGEPTEVKTTINIHFSLDESSPPAATAPPELKNPQVKRVGGAISAPVVLSTVSAAYSDRAKAAHFQGIVLVNLIVDPFGRPQNVHVLRGVGMGLDENAVAAVRQYRFRPAMDRGRPVAVELNVEVDFQSKDNSSASVAPANLNSAAPAGTLPDGATRPVLLYSQQPEFTEAARKAKQMGAVLINMTVNKQGRPENVHVLRGIGYGLDNKAVEAVSKYRFKPAIKDGKPVEEAMNVEVNFQIF